jgi:hypothetical protein
LILFVTDFEAREIGEDHPFQKIEGKLYIKRTYLVLEDKYHRRSVVVKFLILEFYEGLSVTCISVDIPEMKSALIYR